MEFDGNGARDHKDGNVVSLKNGMQGQVILVLFLHLSVMKLCYTISMHIIVGLGNPTEEYKNTRHNAGFMCIDRIAKDYDIDVIEKKHKALIGKGYIDGEKVILVKSLTYMNLSGECVRAVLDYYKLDNDSLIVLYDDIDLEVGRLRIRPKGSAGGHNGIKNIILHTGSDVFKRVRVGVGAKPEKGDLVNHVLGRFDADDAKVIEETLKKVSEAVALLVHDETEMAMNRFNTSAKKEK